MKTLLIIVFVLAIGSITSYFAVSHYDSYQKTKQSDAAMLQLFKEQETTKKVNTITAERNSAKQQVEALRVECLKGMKAYTTLTATQKKTVEAPNCG